MADAFNKFNSFVNYLATKQFNLHSDALNVCLTNTAPSATNTVYSNITEISGGNGYTTGGQQMTLSSDGQTSGLYKLILNSTAFTASGGSIGPFRYAVLYDTVSSYLIGWWDYGTAVTITSGNTYTVTPDPTNGVLQLQ